MSATGFPLNCSKKSGFTEMSGGPVYIYAGIWRSRSGHSFSGDWTFLNGGASSFGWRNGRFSICI